MDARLNVDILSIVSEFLTDYSDVLSFSLVCSTLRPVANRKLLSMRPISLTGDISVKKFHAFLFVDAVARAKHIRALSIGHSKSPLQIANEGDFVSLLVDIITSCPNLEHVETSFAGRPTEGNKPVVLAIAALKTLRSLTLGGSSASAFNILLHNVPSPLRKLAIHSGYIRYPDTLEEFLPRLAPTLEELELLYFRVYRGSGSALDDPLGPQADGQQIHAFRTLTQYPAVRSLSVVCFIGTPLVDRLVHLFPALDSTLSLGLLDQTMNRYSADAVRAVNRRAQEGSAIGTWKKLDRVVCDAPMLYALGLRCPIRLVMLDKGSADTSHYAAAALRENPVPRLKLTLRCGRGMLDGIFTPELAGTLSHLTLCLVYDNKKGGSGTRRRAQAWDADDVLPVVWDELLETALTALQPLHNLTHLRIVITSKRPKRPAPSEPPSSFVASVRGSAFDFVSTTAALVRALPSLQYVFLTTCGSLVSDRDGSEPEAAARTSRACERWNVSRAWRVAVTVIEPGSGGANPNLNAGLVELEDDVAETIIRNEELVLSETDEVALFSSKEA